MPQSSKFNNSPMCSARGTSVGMRKVIFKLRSSDIILADDHGLCFMDTNGHENGQHQMDSFKWTTPNGQLQMDSFKWTIPNGQGNVWSWIANHSIRPFGIVHLPCPFEAVHLVLSIPSISSIPSIPITHAFSVPILFSITYGDAIGLYNPGRCPEEKTDPNHKYR
jgi:hypothetical protein